MVTSPHETCLVTCHPPKNKKQKTKKALHKAVPLTTSREVGTVPYVTTSRLTCRVSTHCVETLQFTHEHFFWLPKAHEASFRVSIFSVYCCVKTIHSLSTSSRLRPPTTPFRPVCGVKCNCHTNHFVKSSPITLHGASDSSLHHSPPP